VLVHWYSFRNHCTRRMPQDSASQRRRSKLRTPTSFPRKTNHHSVRRTNMLARHLLNGNRFLSLVSLRGMRAHTRIAPKRRKKLKFLISLYPGLNHSSGEHSKSIHRHHICIHMYMSNLTCRPHPSSIYRVVCVCVCVCVCVYVCGCVCVNIYIYIYIHAKHKYMSSVCTYVHMYSCVYVCKYAHIHI
jgi:hypothetical protein